MVKERERIDNELILKTHHTFLYCVVFILKRKHLINFNIETISNNHERKKKI